MAHLLNPLTYLREKQEGIRHHSPTGLEATLECPRRRYLQKKFKKKITSPSLAKGTHMHRKIEELRLHHLRNQMGKNPRYKSAEAFANVTAGDWHRQAIKEGKIKGNKILWEYENQGYVMKKEIKDICLRIYPALMKEQEKNPPTIFKYLTKSGEIKFRTGFEFELIYKGRGFLGEIDEVRKEEDKIIIRDYKTGKWGFVEKKLNYAFQPTEYEFIVCLELLRNESLRRVIGVTEDQVSEWIKNPEEMSNNVIFEYFMLDLPTQWDNEKKEYVVVERSPIIRVERAEFHYKELCQNIDIVNAMLSDMQDQRFYPPFRGNHCERCFYQDECNDMTEKADVHTRQLLLAQYVGSTQREYIQVNSPASGAIQTTFDFVKSLKKSKKR